MPAAEDNETEDQMQLLIGETEVPVTWKDNASVEALRALCPLTIHMSMYGGFEQVGPIRGMTNRQTLAMGILFSIPEIRS